ncbi:MAG: hypothetical protein AAGC60_26770 [Acidobacteriota bacterium]
MQSPLSPLCSLLLAFTLLAGFAAPVDGAGFEISQQAGGVVERGVVVGDRLYQPQGQTLATFFLPATGAPVLESISRPLGGTITGVTVLDGALYACWRNQLFAGGLSRLALDDPARPRFVEDLPYSASAFRDPQSVAAVGDRLYLADIEAGGLFLVDPADPASATVAIGFFAADEMILEGTRLTTWSRGFTGQIFATLLDVTNPLAPAVLGDFTAGQMLRADVHDGLYAAVGPEGLRLVDTSNAAMPSEVFHDANVASLVPLSVQLQGDALYFGTTTGFRVWDVATPATATEVATVPAPSGRTMAAAFVERGGAMAGFFVGELGRGLRLGLADALAPSLDAQWDLPVGADSTAVAFLGDHAVISDFYSGLRVAAADDLGQSVGRLDSTGALNAFEDVEVVGSLAFLADWGSGLVIVDLTDPSVPTQLGFLALDFPNSVAVSGDLAVLVSSTNGGVFYVVDIADPSNPSLLGSTPIGQGSEVIFHENLVLIADQAFGGNGGLRIFDITMPQAPQQLGQYTDCGGATAVAARGDLAYLVCLDGLLDVVDLTVPSTPMRVGRFDDPVAFSGEKGLVLDGDRAHAALGGGVRTFDVAGGGDPVLVDTLPLTVSVRSMTSDREGDLWIATGLDGLIELVASRFFADGFESGDLTAWSAVVQ